MQKDTSAVIEIEKFVETDICKLRVCFDRAFYRVFDLVKVYKPVAAAGRCFCLNAGRVTAGTRLSPLDPLVLG